MIQALSDRLPGAKAKAPSSGKIITTLDGHFISKVNGVYEQHILRKMAQEN